MLFSVQDVRGCRIRATDGRIGAVDDVLFDDRTWEIRYVVVETGGWLSGRRVVLPGSLLGTPDWRSGEVGVDLTRDEIERAPGAEAHPPLAFEKRLGRYDDWLWKSYPWGGFVAEPGVRREEAEEGQEGEPGDEDEGHLRSAQEIRSYRVVADDGRIGHVEDFLFAPGEWAIHRVVVDTRNWLPGKKVVVPVREVDWMDWTNQTARIALPKEEIESAPRLDAMDVTDTGPRLLSSS